MHDSQRRVVVVFSRYLTRGGEEGVFEAEVALLRQMGWDVTEFTATTPEIRTARQMVRFGAESIWSRTWNERLTQVVRKVSPAVVHVHNTFPAMSPSVLHAAHRGEAALVHTLHNYRLICPNAICYRDEHECQDCVGRTIPWPGVVHACYRQSRLQSSGVAAMLTLHRALRTWDRTVDLFIAASRFQRDVMVRGGIPAARVVVKPNFVYPDPGPGTAEGSYALYVGRLATSKGLATLLKAWKLLNDVPLKVAGDAQTPAEARMFAAAGQSNIEMLGRVDGDRVLELMRGARFILFPSEWYEGFPLTIIEAFACGVPVLASRLGAMQEVVDDGRTGLHFAPGDAQDLARKARWAWTHPRETARMGGEARRAYEANYTAENNYRQLESIYEQAVRLRASAARRRAGA